MSNDTAQRITAGLSPELTEGLTFWVEQSEGVGTGGQVRTECLELDPETMKATNEQTFLYLAPSDLLRTSGEAGHPFRLDADTARMLRDLLNIATARGYL